MKQINILVFPCGSEIGLEIHRALCDIRFITLFGASSVEDHGQAVYKNYTGDIPFISDEGFVDALNNYIDQNKIDYIFPALDSVILALSQNRERLHAQLLTCPHETVEICRSKSKTYKALEGSDFLPKTYNDINEIENYPVIIKPAESQGSQGFMIIESRNQLEYELSQRKDEQVICEYLPGEEYTIDCFTDKNGKLLYAAQRNRGRIKNGISVSSTLQKADQKVFEIASEINAKMLFRGVWFFQLKRNTVGEYRLLECATRVAGTMCVQRAAGVNLPLLTVFDALGYDIEVPENLEGVTVDRALYNVFKLGIEYDEVYMDFDDTVIIHDKVNFPVLQFIYQCVENKIPVTLLTRHETDIIKDLEERRISPSLFDNIICLPRSERKIDHVNPSKKALFVDDSFAERKSMHDKFGIYTLGPDSVEALLDERK